MPLPWLFAIACTIAVIPSRRVHASDAGAEGGRADAGAPTPSRVDLEEARRIHPGAPPPRTATADPERIVVMFRQAYDRTGHPGALLNLGIALSAIGRHCEAAATLGRYLDRHAAHRAALTARARRFRAEALRRGRGCRAHR